MKTVVGLYDDFSHAQRALEGLRDAGFPSDSINLIHRDIKNEYARFGKEQRHEDVSGGAATGAGIGAVLGGLGGFLASIGALAIPGIGPVLVAGPILATLTGAGIGAVTGGLLGALVDLGIPEEEAHVYSEAVRRGSTMVTVQTTDDMADRAADILNRYDPVDVDKRSEYWRENKWSRFNEAEQPWEADRIEQERARYRNIPVTGEEDMSTPSTGGRTTGRNYRVRIYDVRDKRM